MTRSPSAPPTEAPKPAKRKGTRSVSTLTPSQLARKRANDREAQRAIRARTKEHIERLERELEELKSRHNRDETVQDLIKRNKALERELMALRESLGIQGRPYPTSASGSGSSSRASPYGHGHGHCHGHGHGHGHGSEYSTGSSFSTSYLPTPEPCESWSSVVPVSAVSVPSVVSSPSSSSGNADEYMPGYIPTSVPSNMMESSVIPPPAIPCMDGSEMEYEEMDSDRGYSHSNVHHTPPGYMQQQTWPVYQTASYYPQSPAL